ncbi:MAG: HigA family addiction module antitoxin [Verrucomicrobiota bacterium]|jgi:addiction module HigA family antidote
MADKTPIRYEPQDRTPPGDTLAETLETLGMTQIDLADRVGLSRKTINQIIQGVAPITAETAVKLETALGTPAAFWLNLDANYQEFLARKAQQDQFAAEVAWLKRIPYKELQEKRWIPACQDLAGTVRVALSFFGVASPERWEACWTKFTVRFRKSKLASDELGIVSSWLRKGELDAQKIQTQPFDAEKFHAALKRIRTLTKTEPGVFQPQMRALCADAGVALVFTPELKKLRVNGATYWMTKDKALIQLSLLYKSDHHFWFTFFHEACHVLQEIKTGVFVEGLEDEDHAEQDANTFAADFLIPKDQYAAFVRRGAFSTHEVSYFAEGLNIAPGILVGRLQHDHTIGYDRLNGLKRRFVWAKN